jgi:hypothetical protein
MESVKIAFLGSHALNDIRATFDFNQMARELGSKAQWDVISVIEELSQVDKSY